MPGVTKPSNPDDQVERAPRARWNRPGGCTDARPTARAHPDRERPSGFEAIESQFLALMEAHNLPGASLAISHNGQLVLARGYGMADVDLRQPVLPTSTFGIGRHH